MCWGPDASCRTVLLDPQPAPLASMGAKMSWGKKISDLLLQLPACFCKAVWSPWRPMYWVAGLEQPGRILQWLSVMFCGVTGSIRLQPSTVDEVGCGTTTFEHLKTAELINSKIVIPKKNARSYGRRLRKTHTKKHSPKNLEKSMT